MAEVLIGPPPGAGPPSPRVTVSEAELSPLAGVYRDTTTDQTATVTVAGGSVSVSVSAGEFRFSREGTQWRVIRPSGQGTRSYLSAEAFDAGSVKLDEYAGRYRSAEVDMIYRIRVGAGRLDRVD